MKKVLYSLLFAAVFSMTVQAQEFEIKNYDVKAKVNLTDHAVEVQAKMRLVNLSGRELADKILLGTGNKPRLSFYLHNRAKVTAMSVNGTAAQFKTGEPLRLPMITVATDITTAFASAPEFEVEIQYTIPSKDRSQFLHVSQSESYGLPNGFWVPVYHNPYADHGLDTAPFTLTVTTPVGTAISAGNRTDNTFEQTLAAQPFFFVGNYDVTSVTAEKSAKIEVYAPRGLNEQGKQQVKLLADEATKVVNFYSEYFGIPQIGPFRIIATGSLGLNFSEPGAVALEDSYFRRSGLDLGTIELIAGAAAKSFIDGRVLMRGRGAGMMRDGLPVYFVAQYLGSRFGAAQQEAAFERYRRAYEPVARGTDSALILQSPYDRNYTTVVYNKGALVWRMLEKKIGKAVFDSLIRGLLDRQKVDVVSLTEWRTPLCRAARCADIKSNLVTAAGKDRSEMEEIFTQWIENVIVPDFAVGQPQAAASGMESAIVNFGSGDVNVDVTATTESGQKLTQKVLLKGGEYGAVTFPAGTNIKRIEVDPDKLYPQKDYSNDVFPRLTAPTELYGQASLAFTKKEYATAEAKIREALLAEPDSPVLQSLLGRILSAQNKNDEASQVFVATLKREPVPLQAYAWSHLGLGQLALQANKHAEAATHFRLAAASNLDQGTALSARDGLIQAEQKTSVINIPEDVRALIKQLDDALLTGSPDAVRPLVEQGNLGEFVKRATGSKPSVWTTEILRAEVWDADRVAVDVNVKVKIIGKEGAGRALYILNRASGKLKLSEVPFFDVK